jgi:hypothetical protein
MHLKAVPHRMQEYTTHLTRSPAFMNQSQWMAGVIGATLLPLTVMAYVTMIGGVLTLNDISETSAAIAINAM